MTKEITKTDTDLLDEVDELRDLVEEQRKFLEELTSKVLTRGTATVYRPDEYIPMLLDHMGIQGKSYQSFAFKIGVQVKTLYNWEKRHIEWKRAKELASEGRLSVIEDSLMNLATGKTKGNAAAAIFYAKNAAPDQFKDKREIDVSGSVSYIIDTGIPSKSALPENVVEQIVHDDIQDCDDITDVEYSEISTDDNEDVDTDLL